MDDPGAAHAYKMKLSRLTVDKLGVKLYDRVSAVVAELIANGYDADAETVTVELPLGTELARGAGGEQPEEEEQPDLFAALDADDVPSPGGTSKDWSITVRDDGHGMTPQEAQDYFLVVGADRRKRPTAGARSKSKNRPVMGRKGIGKLAPFGICRRIEVLSAGGARTARGYLVSHFVLDFDRIVRDTDEEVDIESGPLDRSYDERPGTTVTLSQFLPKRVPATDVFIRQVARRFALAQSDFKIIVEDTRQSVSHDVPPFQVDINEDTRVQVDDRPVPLGGRYLPVKGWLAFGKHAYKNEEEAGVRIYARDKIVATTRDFEQPAGFTGEFAARSYLVGEIHAEWLDDDDAEDLIRTDRQGILWDSEYGQALRAWGSKLIKEIAKASAGPRRDTKAERFLLGSRLVDKAGQRYSDPAVIQHAERLGRLIGGFASEDELGDPDYVADLADVVLSVAPHQALIETFKRISGQDSKNVDELLDLFSQTRMAEMASYAQIASERVESIRRLRATIDDPGVTESDLQNLIASAPWLIEPSWSVITDNQTLKTFRDRFVQYWKTKYGTNIDVAITYESKRPDFTLIHSGRRLHVVEIKRPGHAFDGDDYKRLENYLEALPEFMKQNAAIAHAFPDGWVVDLVADGVKITNTTQRRAFEAAERDKSVVRSTWADFLSRSTVAHEQFLNAHDAVEQAVATGVAPEAPSTP
jgi:hypothetical protein